jgi:hypothetical protein
VLAVLAAGWVVLPIVLRRLALLGDVVAGGVLDAEARKRVALASLKEVEYDRLGGKLDDADYQHLRRQLEREALVAIAAAENVEGRAGAVPAGIPHGCGFLNPAGSRFCAGCGKPLG